MTTQHDRRAVSLEPAFRLAYYYRQSRAAWRQAAEVARQLGWPSPTGNPLSAHKHSDTLFVLGSGSSVLTFSEDDWRTIASNDSLGFNYWMLHPFVPSSYLLEMTTADADDLNRIARNVEARHDYRGTPIYVKDIGRCADAGEAIRHLAPLSSTLGPLRPIWDAELAEGGSDMFCRTLVWLNRLGGFSGRGPWAVPRNRATVFLAVNLAVRAGYRTIVLGGVDLNNTDYFFRAPGFTLLPGLELPPESQFGRVHSTNDPTQGAMTISVLLDTLDRLVLRPRGIQLLVAKRSSALHPRFPAYFA